MTPDARPSGLRTIGDLPWGSHFCHFFQTTSDLLDVLIPFFREGLAAREFCVWMISGSLTEGEAAEALRRGVPGADRHLAAGDLIFATPHDFMLTDGVLDVDRAVERWAAALGGALQRGYAGMRITGTPAWTKNVDLSPGGPFGTYERRLNELLQGRRMLVACTFPLETTNANDVFDIAQAHRFVVARREGAWLILQTPELLRALEDLRALNDELKARVLARTSDLAAQKEILQRIFDHIPVMIGLLDTSGRITLANREWERQRSGLLKALEEPDADADADADEAGGTAEAAGRRFDNPDAGPVREHIARASGEWRDFRLRSDAGGERDTSWAAVGLSDRTRVTIGQDITERKQIEEQLKTTTEQLRALAASASSAREQESVRIARELHDELGSTLTSLKWDLESIRNGLAATSRIDPRALAQQVDGLLKIAEASIASVRRIASELRPRILDELGLVAAIEWQAQQFGRRSGIAIDLDVRAGDLLLPPDRATAVFRIFQEALTNVLRHARASRVRVSVTAADGELVLSVVDNGVGIGDAAGGNQWSLGLAGMRERARLVGATLSVRQVADGQGTEVRVQLPL
jgi:two-component sensor histidine kinase